MAFSTAGSVLLLFLGVLLMFGTVVTVGANTAERVSEAREAKLQDERETLHTAINITTASYNSSTGNLTLTIDNTGSRTLSTYLTDILINNTYVNDTTPCPVIEESSVEPTNRTAAFTREDTGAGVTSVWAQQKSVTYVIDVCDFPERVVVATEHGVTDAASLQNTSEGGML